MRIHVFITAALLGLLSATHGVVAQNVAAMSDEDLFVLQRRLKDSGCYIGVLDRNRSPALEAGNQRLPESTSGTNDRNRYAHSTDQAHQC